MSVNKVIIVGRLGQDPEMKYTASGMGVCNFSVATSEKWTDKSGQQQERTEWHRIVVWGKLSEICHKYLTKGSQAYVEGALQTRSWEDKDGNKRYTTEINAKNVQFLGAKSSGASRPTEDNPYDQAANVSEAEASFTADDIPF